MPSGYHLKCLKGFCRYNQRPESVGPNIWRLLKWSRPFQGNPLKTGHFLKLMEEDEERLEVCGMLNVPFRLMMEEACDKECGLPPGARSGPSWQSARNGKLRPTSRTGFCLQSEGAWTWVLCHSFQVRAQPGSSLELGLWCSPHRSPQRLLIQRT